MNRLRIVFATFVLAIGLVAAPVIEAAPGTGFTGSWTSTDLDGSAQSLSISRGDLYRLLYTDMDAPGTCAGAPVAIFTSTLTGTASGNLLEAAINSARCGSTALPDLVGYPIDFTYDGSTDTLFGIGVTWYRSGAS